MKREKGIVMGFRIGITGVVMMSCLFTGNVLSGAEKKVLHDFTRNAFLTTYLDWKGKVAGNGDGLEIRATGKGGGLVNAAYDLRSVADGTLALRLKVLPGNKESLLRIMLRDRDGTARFWSLPLKGCPEGKVMMVHVAGALPLSQGEQEKGGKVPGLDLGHIQQFHIQGSFRGRQPLAVALYELAVLPNS
ncbi:MAG: hypothetical protein D6820_03040, partial [Lentisphaerae bacterium]